MPDETNLATKAAAAATPGVLADRADLALIAVERMRVPMVVTDPNAPDNPIVLANQAFLDMCGYSADEVIGRNCRFLQGPGTDPHAVTQIRRDLEERRESLVELLNYRKDGSSYWNILQLSPVCDTAGRLVYYMGSQRNTSAEHESQALAASEVALLREIDHRAKNALALVQGIVRLSRADNAADYAAAVQGRVTALATAHGLLADRNWQTVPLDVLIATMVRGMALTGVTAAGPPVGIAPAQVQPLALILHEVLCNAERHGGLSAAGGRLAVAWHVEPDSVVIRLSETGGPATAMKRRPGFGLTIVDAVTTRQLRGRVAFDWQPGGLTTTLTIPRVAAD